MKPKNRTVLIGLDHWSDVSNIRLGRMERNLRNAAEDLASEFDELHMAVITCQESIQSLAAKLEACFDADEMRRKCCWNEELSDAEIARLLVLNRRLMDLTRHLRSVAEDVTPRLEARLADPDDPMFDYEIEAVIQFTLLEDDPDYAEDDDNFLTTRTESLKCLRLQDDEDFGGAIPQKRLLAEPHCWLFHDLHDHDHGIESPRLSFHDCLRIGSIWVDVQVWQQYDFDVTAVPAAVG